MSKYKTMEEWYKEALDEGRLWKDTKISTAEYKRRVQEARKNPETLAYAQEVKSRFKLFNPKEETVSKWSPEREKYHWMRAYYITTGRYERIRFKQWKVNYIEAMKKTGVSEDTIKEFDKLMTFESRDLINLLPSWRSLYVQPLYETAGNYVNEQEQQIKKGLSRKANFIKEYRATYMKRYRALNRERNRTYMRAYMKAYRARKKNR